MHFRESMHIKLLLNNMVLANVACALQLLFIALVLILMMISNLSNFFFQITIIDVFVFTTILNIGTTSKHKGDVSKS